MCCNRAVVGFVLGTAAYGLSWAILLGEYENVWLDSFALLLGATASTLLAL